MHHPTPWLPKTLAVLLAALFLSGISLPAQLLWTVGLDDNGWPAGDGGGPNATFVQEAGTNPLPGNPASPEVNQQADDDYYFAGVYTTVITGNGAYTPVGVIAVNEEAAERAFAGTDNDKRYHFNLPNTLRPFDLLSVTFDANNLHDGQPDPRYGVEIYFNGVKVQDQIVIRAPQLNVDYTTPQFSLASVNAQTGPGADNIVSLRGINYNAEGGGNWMGIDYVQLNATPGVEPGYKFADCTTPAGTVLFGSGAPNGTIGDDGSGVNCVLHLTDANQASAFGVFRINDLAAGNNVDHLNIKWRSRIGGGQNGGADGYSLNWANDLPAAPSYGNPGEEGVGTGLSFNVDTWDNGGGDLPGIEIKYKGAQVAFQQLGKDSGTPTYLRKDVFVNAEADVSVAGVATFTYDGVTITANLPGWGGIAGGSYMFGARSGGANDNHWIDDIFVTAFAPGLPFITRQPTNQTVRAGLEATFSVAADGTPPFAYQWLIKRAADAGFSPIPGATASTYTTPPTVFSTDNNAELKVQISNSLGATESAVAILGVVPDVTPPAILSAVCGSDFLHITLNFSEELVVAVATDNFNYTVSGGSTVSAASLSPDRKTVTLRLDSPQAEATPYTVTVNNMEDLAGNIIPLDTQVSFVSCVGGCNGVLLELYTGIGGTAVSALTSAAKYPNSPDRTLLLPSFNAGTGNGDNFGDNFGGRMRGIFIPPVSGNYVFYLASDDASQLFLNPNGVSAAGKVKIQEETGCCGPFSARASAPIPLVAGQGAYIEALFKEGGGGDYLRVAVRLQGQPAPVGRSEADAIPGSMLGVPGAPVGIGGVLAIAQQPADVTVLQNRTAAFTVGLSNPNDLPVCYQWFRDGVAIDGATSASYSLLATLADSGARFSVKASIIGSTALSQEALLIVNPDVTAPACVSASGTLNLSNIMVRFDELLSAASATDVFNYAMPGFTFVNATFQPDGKSVLLQVDPALTPDTDYTVSIQNLADLVGNPQPSVCTLSFRSFTQSCGFALQELYFGIGGGSVADLRSNAAYPNSPSSVRYKGSLQANTGDEFDNYGTRMSGWLLPPVSGNYNFFMSSDDGGELWLSTDASPANLVQIASEPVWNGRREWITFDRRNAAAPENRSSTLFPAGIPLVAGQKYYFEALMKEGGGGDNLAVTWQLPGAPLPLAGSPEISGAYIASLADPVGAAITVTQQPGDASVPGCASPVCFTVAMTAVNSSGNNPPVFYQWERSDDGGAAYQSVVGANSAQLCFTPTTFDSGAKFRARIYIPGATAASDAATLTVTADPVQPQIVSAARGASPRNVVKVTFSEAVDAASANNAANYSIDNGVVVTGAALGSDGRTVALTTAADLNDVCHILTVGAVLDRCANPVNASSGINLLLPYAPGGDGNIVFEAEDFDGNVNGTLPHRWVFSSTATGTGAYSGRGYMDSTPNSGAGPNEDVATVQAPRLDYIVNFPTAGTWYAWVRGLGSDGANNSAHIGIDGAISPNGRRIGNGNGRPAAEVWGDNAWKWITDSTALPMRIEVPTAGLHTVNIWMREDAVKIDKVLLTMNAAFAIAPRTSVTPAANPRPAFALPPTVGLISPSDGAIVPACAPVTICADPRLGCANLGSIVSVAFLANGQPIGVATASPWCITVPAAGVQPGSYTLTATVTDSTGQQATSAPRIVTVSDTEAPTITCPADLTDQAPNNSGAIVSYVASAADVCGLRSFECQPPSGSLFPIGITTVVCVAVDTAGNSASCSFKITVLPDNRPPTAIITATPLTDFTPEVPGKLLVSCNGSNACLILDGLLSSDPESPLSALTFDWFLAPSSVPFASGVLATTCLELGTHTIKLVVTDPAGATGSDSVTVEVISSGEAIEELISKINESSVSRKNKRPFIATLKAAAASAERGQAHTAANQLQAFQNKVQAQVSSDNPADAAIWTNWAQQIIDALDRCAE